MDTNQGTDKTGLGKSHDNAIHVNSHCFPSDLWHYEQYVPSRENSCFKYLVTSHLGESMCQNPICSLFLAKPRMMTSVPANKSLNLAEPATVPFPPWTLETPVRCGVWHHVTQAPRSARRRHPARLNQHSRGLVFEHNCYVFVYYASFPHRIVNSMINSKVKI